MIELIIKLYHLYVNLSMKRGFTLNLLKAIKAIAVIRTIGCLKTTPYKCENLICSIWSENNFTTYFSTWRYLKKHAPEHFRRYNRYLLADEYIIKKHLCRKFPRGILYKFINTERRKHNERT